MCANGVRILAALHEGLSLEVERGRELETRSPSIRQRAAGINLRRRADNTYCGERRESDSGADPARGVVQRGARLVASRKVARLSAVTTFVCLRRAAARRSS